jgi:hypothetical protein
LTSGTEELGRGVQFGRLAMIVILPIGPAASLTKRLADAASECDYDVG